MGSQNFLTPIPKAMSKKYISIQDAADLSKKSVQTIRRAIKAKKISSRRKRTPQGFNYMVDLDSLNNAFGLKPVKEEVKETKKAEPVKKTTESKDISIGANDFKDFVKTMETLLAQHNEERKSFLQLVNTLQEKIFVLENQLNLLKAPPKKRWFSFRK